MYRFRLSVALIACLFTIPALAVAGPLGLGIIIGEPTGVSGNLYLSGHTSVDAAVAWSFANNGGFHLHADYLFHEQDAVAVDGKSHTIPWYIGAGLRWRSNDNGAKDQFGIRVPVGLEFRVTRSKQMQLFVELVPLLDVAPSTHFRINAAIGARWYFGGGSGSKSGSSETGSSGSGS